MNYSIKPELDLLELEDNELVSVIIPVYNTDKYLNRCLDSVVNQSYRKLEIIIVNDGSEDGCEKIINSYAIMDRRIKSFLQSNKGAGTARNLGLNHARGEYILFLDSDDWLDEDCILFMINNIGNSDILQIGTTMYLAETGEIYGHQINKSICGIHNNKQICLALLKGEYETGGVPWGKLYRRRLWEGIEFPSIYRFEDTAVLYQVYWKSNSVNIMAEEKYCYSSHRTGSIMHSAYDETWLEILDILSDRIIFFERRNEIQLSFWARVAYCREIYINTIKLVENGIAEKKLLQNLKDKYLYELRAILKTKGYYLKKVKLVILYLQMYQKLLKRV